MHPLKMLFDEINHDCWGMPSKESRPVRRRRGPAPRVLVAAGDAARVGIGRLALSLRRLIGARNEPSTAEQDVAQKPANRANASLYLVKSRGGRPGERLDRAA